jgi:hypothetical protein
MNNDNLINIVTGNNKNKFFGKIKDLYELSERLTERKIPYALMVPKEEIDNARNCINKFKKTHKKCIIKGDVADMYSLMKKHEVTSCYFYK